MFWHRSHSNRSTDRGPSITDPGTRRVLLQHPAGAFRSVPGVVSDRTLSNRILWKSIAYFALSNPVHLEHPGGVLLKHPGGSGSSIPGRHLEAYRGVLVKDPGGVTLKWMPCDEWMKCDECMPRDAWMACDEWVKCDGCTNECRGWNVLKAAGNEWMTHESWMVP